MYFSRLLNDNYKKISMNFPLNPKVLLVLAIPLLVIIYLFANRPNSGAIDEREGNQPENYNPEMWQNLDLLSQNLPSNIGEFLKKVKIQQSEQNIGGAATYIQVVKEKVNTT